MRILKIPKVQMALALFLIAVTAFLHNPTPGVVTVFLMAVGFSVFFDLLFLWLRRIKLFFPYAAIVSGLIIGLLTNPSIVWYQIMAIAGFAMAGKSFVRFSGKHVFNPAAIGLFAAGLLFHQTVSWWAVSFQTLSAPLNMIKIAFFVVLLFPFLVSGFRMRRFVSSFGFIIIYSLVLSILISHTFSLQRFSAALLDPTVVFFSIVMLPEPMTSPVNFTRQFLYAGLISLAVIFLSQAVINNLLTASGLLPDTFIVALLLGNLVFFRFR